ncbi:copper resistance protein CopC [Nocardioides sp.]|uniref:copper resistance CopC family protein n=1 Tax=Nocardioides sp. TaxID=35761 RepID=UPI003518CFBB
MIRPVPRRRRTTSVVAGVAGARLLSPLVATAPASAHATLVGRTPQDGAVLRVSSTPTTVSVTFDEEVTITPSSLRVRGPRGAVLSGNASLILLEGDQSRVQATTRKALPRGGYAVEYSIESADGHRLTQATGFGVGVSTPASSTARIALGSSSSGAAPRTTISGTRVGARSISVRMPADTNGGQVQLTCNREGSTAAKVGAPFVWELGRTVNGVATASGYLPTACRYTVVVTLSRPFPQAAGSWRTGTPIPITA